MTAHKKPIHRIHCLATDHHIYNCKTFGSLDVTQRFNFAKSNALFLNCLKKGHSVAHCNSFFCRICKGAHHTLLHRQQNQTVNKSIKSPSTSKNAVLNTSSSTVTNSENNVVLLATAVVQLRDNFGNLQNARAMLDSGSQINIITDEFANRLKIKRYLAAVHITGIGERSADINQQISTIIKSKINNHEFVQLFNQIST